MNDLTPEQHAELAVNGTTTTNGAVYVEASTNPADIGIGDYQLVQWHHRQGNEAELMRLVQDIHRRAYKNGQRDRRANQ